MLFGPAPARQQLPAQPLADQSVDRFATVEFKTVEAEVLRRANMDTAGDGIFWDSFEYESDGNGLSGLGAVKKTAAPATPDKVTVPVPQPIKQSTIYLVVGGAVVLVGGAIALWAWSKMKKGR